MANHVSHAALPYPIKGARFSVLIPYLDADGDPTDPAATIDTEVSKDGAAFADAAEEAAAITGGRGTALITFSGAELDVSALAVYFGCATAKPTLMQLYPRNLPILAQGTASAGAAGSITLAGGPDYDITGCFVKTTGGTGGGGSGGANNQARRITAYNTSTKVATVTPNWETTPDNTTTFDVLCPEGVTPAMLKGLVPTTPGRTLDVSAAGNAGIDWSNVEAPTTVVGLSGTTIKTATDVETDTADIQTRLPATLVSGRIDASVGAAAANVITASALAADAAQEIADAIQADIAVQAGTAQAGAASTITLAAPASATNDLYKGMIVLIDSGTGAGQARVIASYVGATKVATVGRAWEVTPDNTSVYRVLAADAAVVDASGKVALTTAEHTSIRSDVQTAMDSQGFTTTRAGYLDTLNNLLANIWNRLTADITTANSIGKLIKDNLDAAISTRSSHAAADVWGVGTRTLTSFGTLASDTATAVWAAGTRTLTSFGTLVADIWANGTRTLTSLGASLANEVRDAVWDRATSALTTVGSVGKLIVDNLNATISSRSSHSAADVWAAGTRTLTSYGTLVADIWANGTRSLTTFGTLAADTAAAVWNYLTASATTVGSLGKKIADWSMDSSGRVTLAPVQGGTAQAGGASTLTLAAAGASAQDDLYNGQLLVIDSGTGANQSRTILDYNGTTKVATLDRAWLVTPDNTSVYRILAADGPALDASLKIGLQTAEHTAIATDVQTGLTAQGYTSTRAGYLDTLNGLVAAIWASGTRTLTSYGTLAADTATAVWASGTRTLTSFGTLVADIWANGTRTLTSLGASLVNEVRDAVWDRATSALTTAGSIGKKLADLVLDSANRVVVSATNAGTAQAGGASTITLAAGASAQNDLYRGQAIVIDSGVGAGQVRSVLSYVGATKVATVDRAWDVVPDATSVYRLLPSLSPALDASLKVALTSAEHTAVATDVQTGLTAQGYTGARATKIDQLDAAVSSRSSHSAADVWASGTRTLTSFGTLAADTATAVWAAGTRTLTSFGTLVADIWAAGTRTLTSYGTLTTDAAAAVWDRLTTAITTVGSIGKQLKDNVDAAVSTRSSHSVADIWANGTRSLTTYGTLVADVATAVWGAGTRTLTSLGSVVSDVAAAVWDRLTSALTTPGSIGESVVDKLDQRVSTRLASGSYTAPDNASIALVKANTDKLGNMIEADGADWRFDANSLELAPVAGGGAADWTSAEKSEIKAVLGIEGDGTPTESPLAGVLAVIKNMISALTAGSVAVTSPVLPNGDVEVVAGYDYTDASGSPLTWAVTGAPSLVGATVTLVRADRSETLIVACTVINAGAATQTVKAQLTGAQTAALAGKPVPFRIKAVLANASEVALVQGHLTIR